MLFNSFEFAAFLAIVLATFWNLKTTLARNTFLLFASYYFYGVWDYRFLSLIIFSSLCDFYLGRWMSRSKDSSYRKRCLYTSLAVNLGLLGLFKYFNFFIDSFAELLIQLGVEANLPTLQLILPVGISFYTFQTLSYTIDIYRGKIEEEKRMLNFFAYVSFFPQLVAGPIERAQSLLPQFREYNHFKPNEAIEGLRQILWGLFLKIVIADQCAPIVNGVFGDYQNSSSIMLAVAAVLFSFQIYGDFAGYSNIAIGTARLFGFKLMRNFAYPYFSRDMAEFWRRWHISLSTWFRDYLYIPLGGNQGSRARVIRNTFLTFIISGFWHGANWTFIVWGALNALYFLPLMLTKRNRRNIEIVAIDRSLPNLRELFAILLTFGLSTLAWVFFRSESIGDAFNYLDKLLSIDLSLHDISLKLLIDLLFVATFISFLLITEWSWRRKEYPFQEATRRSYFRWAYYLVVGLLVLVYANSNQSQFIYFQF